MSIEQLRDMRNRPHFRPFNIHLDTGEVLHVAHPDLMSFSPAEDMFHLWEGPTWNLIEVDAVKRVSTLTKAKLTRTPAA